MIEVVITYPDRKEKQITLYDSPTNEYNVPDLSWMFHRYDEAGRYFRMPELALEKTHQIIDNQYRSELEFIKTVCHTNVRGLLPFTPKYIEPYKVGSTVRIIKGAYPLGKTAIIIALGTDAAGKQWPRYENEHPFYLLDNGVIYYHCELELVKSG